MRLAADRLGDDRHPDVAGEQLVVLLSEATIGMPQRDALKAISDETRPVAQRTVRDSSRPGQQRPPMHVALWRPTSS